MTHSGGLCARLGPRSATRLLAGAVVVLAGFAGAVVAPAPARAETVRAAQWHLRALDIASVHKITRGSGVLVAVVDTGIEATHPDLKGQVRAGTGIGAGAGPAGGLADIDNHGTSMAGIIAARGGGANSVLGIAPGAKVFPVRVVAKGRVSARDLADGIRWAADHGAKVINVSIADSREESLFYEDEAIAYALAKDAVVVAGAGNRPDGHDVVGVPARIPGVLAVGGTTRSGQLWSGSVTGPQVALTAPCEDIVGPGSKRAGSKSGFVTGTGTSAATAIVSGAAALIRAKYPDLKAPDVINRLIATADDAGPAGRDDKFGFGKLNIKRALTAKVPPVQANPLGVPGGASATPAQLAAGDEESGTLTRDALIGLIIIGVIVIGIPVALVVLLIVLVRRSRRRRPPPPWPGIPAGWSPPPQPGPAGGWSHPQPGTPAGWPPPPPAGAPGAWQPPPQPGTPARWQPQPPPGPAGEWPPQSPPEASANWPPPPPPPPPGGN